MALKVALRQVWCAPITDQPGGLNAKLAALSQAGANLDFCFARRAPEKPGTGVVFVTPLKGAKQLAAAKAAGFNASGTLHSLRVDCGDSRGIGAKITAAIAGAGISLRGFSASAVAKKAVFFLAFDSAADAAAAAKALKKL
jgi:hypothetical protein